MKKDSYFYGEHFEGNGQMRRGLYGNADDFLKDYLRRSVSEAKSAFDLKMNNKLFYGLIYQACENIKLLHYIENVGQRRNEHCVMAPILKGIKNKLKLKELYTWKNGIEGEIAARTLTVNDLILNFYDPFYPFDKDIFKKDEEKDVYLSAIALTAEEFEEGEEVYTEGNLYESYLKQFLKENPDKTEADFEPVVINFSAEHARMCMSTNITSVYEIIGLIEDMEYIEAFGKKFAVLKVNIEHREDDEYLYVNVYVGEHLLNNYKPEVGKGFQGGIHLFGHFEPTFKPIQTKSKPNVKCSYIASVVIIILLLLVLVLTIIGF